MGWKQLLGLVKVGFQNLRVACELVSKRMAFDPVCAILFWDFFFYVTFPLDVVCTYPLPIGYLHIPTYTPNRKKAMPVRKKTGYLGFREASQ